MGGATESESKDMPCRLFSTACSEAVLVRAIAADATATVRGIWWPQRERAVRSIGLARNSDRAPGTSGRSYIDAENLAEDHGIGVGASSRMTLWWRRSAHRSVGISISVASKLAVCCSMVDAPMSTLATAG
jgi:hypothetical protein